MSFIDIFKGSGISLASWVTSRLEPYQEFTRATEPPPPSQAMSMDELALQFYADLTTGFGLRDGTIIQSRIPLDPKLPADLGDQAIWHGYVTAMQAVTYAMKPTDAHDLRLKSYLQGMRDQQPNGVLMRGLDDKGNFRWDASNDSGSGHMIGLTYAFMYGSDAVRKEAARLLDEWASSIISNDYALVNPDGKRTTYGQLEDGWKTDPLRLTLLLAILLSAYNATGGILFRDHYTKLKRRYTPLLAAPPLKALGFEKYPDLHRVAAHLSVLADLDKESQHYLAGLESYRRMARYQGNVLILALCARRLAPEDQDRAIAKKVMSEFSFASKTTNPGRQLSLKWSDKSKWPLYDGQWVSRQPIAKWRKRAQDNEWARHPYSLDSGIEGEGADSRFHGGDFLMAYVLSKKAGLL